MNSFLRGNPTFARFMLGRFLASFSDQLLLFAIPLIIYKNTGSVAKSGLAFFIEWLPRVLSLPIAGVLSDRFGGVRVFKISDLCRGLACAVVFLILAYFPQVDAFWVLSLLAAFTAFFYSQSFVSLESTVPRVLPKDHLPKGQALLQACDQASSVFGPLLAGIIVTFWPRSSLIALSGALFLLSFLNLAFLKLSQEFKDRLAVQAGKLDVIAGIKVGFSHIRNNRLLLILVALSASINLIFGTVMSLCPGIATGIYGVSDRAYSFVNSSVGAMSILCLVLLPYLLRVTTILRLSLTALGVMLLGSLIVSVSGSFAFFVLGYAFMMGGVNLFNVYMRSERARLIPKADLGRVIGVMVLLNQLSLPFSGLMVATLTSSLSPQQILGGVTLFGWVVIPILTLVFLQQTRVIILGKQGEAYVDQN